MVVAGCDVRPFTELLGEDSAEENETGSGSETDGGEGGEGSDSSESLEFTPVTIETSENTSQTVEVTVVNPDPDRTYTFEITTPLTNGTTQINENTGRLSFTYTPNTDFDGSDSLVVTVTDDGSPARSGDITITITVNPG